MRWLTLLFPLLFLAGCAARKPVAVHLTPRRCPALSVAHVVCLGHRPEGVASCPTGGHLEEICEDTQTHGLFDMSTGYNPYQNIDGEDEGPRKKHEHHPWWKFWVKRSNDKDSD